MIYVGNEVNVRPPKDFLIIFVLTAAGISRPEQQTMILPSELSLFLLAPFQRGAKSIPNT